MKNEKEVAQNLSSKNTYSAAFPTLPWEKDEPGFRDHIQTISELGKRAWIYAQKPIGKFYNIRTLLSYFLIIFFLSGPFLKWNGHPFLLFDILNRKFIFFGLIFWPQDFYLLVLGVLSMILFIALFTSIFGRVWCGYACPQTIFMEMLFRKIEYWIEGDASKQRELDQAKWDANKIFKKGTKLIIFYFLSFFIANIFLAYIIGDDALFQIILEDPRKHIIGLCMILLFSLVFFLVFARFREQVCHFACPYGRFQSVLVDTKTIGVTYDSVRGEKRGTYRDRHLFAKENPSLQNADIKTISKAGKFGDCVNCGMCVKVCPEGIDIRNGIQLECIQCAACIDACDHIMEQVGLPKGLIRYTSIDAVLNKVKNIFTFRHFAYTGIFIIVLGLFINFLIKRPEVEGHVLREPGTMYQKLSNGDVSNLYQVKLFNKTFQNKNIDLILQKDNTDNLNMQGHLQWLNTEKELRGQSLSVRRFLIIYPKKFLKNFQREEQIRPIISILENNKVIRNLETVFLRP